MIISRAQTYILNNYSVALKPLLFQTPHYKGLQAFSYSVLLQRVYCQLPGVNAMKHKRDNTTTYIDTLSVLYRYFITLKHMIKRDKK